MANGNKYNTLDDVYAGPDTVLRVEFKDTDTGERIRQETAEPHTSFDVPGIAAAFSRKSSAQQTRVLGQRGNAALTSRRSITTMSGDRAVAHFRQLADRLGMDTTGIGGAPPAETPEERGETEGAENVDGRTLGAGGRLAGANRG